MTAEGELVAMAGTVNAPKGRFATPLARAEALYLNDTSQWYCCPQNHWHDQAPGEECMECGELMRRERRPDRGSVFAQVYDRYFAERKDAVREEVASWQATP